MSRSGAEATAQGHVVSRVTREPARSYVGRLGWGAALAAVVAGVGLVASTRKPVADQPRAQTTTATEAAASVEVAVDVTPPALPGLSISIAGNAVSPQAPERSVARGTEPLVVEVRAPGYRSAQLSVVPDRNRSVSVALVPAAPSVAPPASADTRRSPAAVRAPAAAPSGVIRRYPF